MEPQSLITDTQAAFALVKATITTILAFGFAVMVVRYFWRSSSQSVGPDEEDPSDETRAQAYQQELAEREVASEHEGETFFDEDPYERLGPNRTDALGQPITREEAERMDEWEIEQRIAMRREEGANE